jgi:hypothetical protein
MQQSFLNVAHRKLAMKPYGLPRSSSWEYPDLGDVREYGLKSSTARLPGLGGDIRASNHSKSKRATRRYFKRKARHEGKQEILEGLKETLL